MSEPIALDQVDVELLELQREIELSWFRRERDATEEAGRELELGGGD